MKIAMKYPQFALLIVAVVMQLILPQVSMADFFKYKDNKGNLIITNRFEDVPKKYRNRVIVVWDKDLTAKDPLARRSAAAVEQYEQQEANKKAQQQVEEKKTPAKKGKTLVIELDENTGQLIRRFE
jgi:exopolysaccharide biosynthesis protein